MQVINQKIQKNIPFNEYLKIPGISYSDIKNEGREFKAATHKMQLGTNVHNYLLTPADYTHEDARIVKPIAWALKKQLGDLLPYLHAELTVTCNFVYNGFILPYRGRVDLGIPDRLVVDIKVTEMPIRKGIAYFGYDNQLCGYALGLGAKVAIIIAINPKTLKIEIVNIPIQKDWWEYQITQKGEPIL